MEILLLTIGVLLGSANPRPAFDAEIHRVTIRELAPRFASTAAYHTQRPPLTASRFPRWTRGHTIFCSAVIGMLAGASIGVAMDRNSSEPGMAGLVYGVPVGTLAGGVVGWLLTR